MDRLMQLDGGKLLKAKYLKVILLDLGQVHVGASQWLKFLHPSRTPCMHSTHEVSHCNAPGGTQDPLHQYGIKMGQRIISRIITSE